MDHDQTPAPTPPHTLTWSQWVASFVWSASASQSPPPLPPSLPQQVLPTQQLWSYGIDCESVQRARAALRPVSTVVRPTVFPSAIAHIAELNELVRSYRKQQRQQKRRRISVSNDELSFSSSSDYLSPPFPPPNTPNRTPSPG